MIIVMSEKSALNPVSESLIWIDMEMSGLKPESDRILEIALIITDANLNLLATAPVYVVHQSDAVLDQMDSWNTGTHSKSGLIDKVKASRLDETMVEQAAIDFLKQYLKAGVSPMCGNSICQDRRFMARYMPKLEAFFHYRNVDVSTIKELAKRWQPDLMKGFVKQQAHTALADILESIEELKYYREKFFIAPIP
ncbi:Orn Oligoribonuclease (3'-_5' exoribonuclease) [Burkholderiaceae bacterium]